MRDPIWKPTSKSPAAKLAKRTERWFQGQIEAAVKAFVEEGDLWIETEYGDGYPILRFLAAEPLDHIDHRIALEEVLNHCIRVHCDYFSKGFRVEHVPELTRLRDVLVKAADEITKKLAKIAKPGP